MNLSFEQFREQVRDRTDLVSLVSASTEVKHRGGRVLMCKCPFHADAGPSLALYVDQQRWHCYGGCGTGGDVFAWVMRRDNVDFMEALRTLARDAGLQVPDFSNASPEQKNERDAAEKMLRFVARFYHARLLDPKHGAAHREYLLSRGFGEETWKQWMLGAAGNENELLRLLERQKLDVKLAITLGLVGEYDGYRTDRFKNRVTIPFLEPGGRVAFFTARRIDGEKDKKYLHLHNSALASKPLYNWRAKGKTAVIVEGPMDAWAVDALGNQVAAIALMGLEPGDQIERSCRGRDQVIIGLDSDGTVARDKVEALALRIGLDRARVVSWPGGDDAAAWLKAGAVAADFSALLEAAPLWLDAQIEAAAGAADKAAEAERLTRLISTLPQAQADIHLTALRRSLKGSGIQPQTLAKLTKEARKQTAAAPPKPARGKEPPPDVPPDGAPAQAEQPQFYRVKDGRLVYGDESKSITWGGYARYTEMVDVDDGEGVEAEISLEVRLADGGVRSTRMRAKDTANTAAVAGAIKGLVGPALAIEPSEINKLTRAIDAVSVAQGMVRTRELAHTGWVETDRGLAYVTPGGVVGELPENCRVTLPHGLEKYAVRDDGDEAFAKGMEGLMALLSAFDHQISVPLLAYGLLPPLARFFRGSTRFGMHLSGETGSQKSTTAKILMGLYGPEWVEAPAIANWKGTISSVERMGFWAKDALGVIDEYKPRFVKTEHFVELMHRYADGNDRSRLARDSTLMRRSTMRWWLLSTGEDIPAGESSVLARMVTLRFRRGETAWNEPLQKARELAPFFATVMARWIAWMPKYVNDIGGLSAMWKMDAKQLSEALRKALPGAPNVNRIADNLATLWTCWSVWTAFVEETAPELVTQLPGFKSVAGKVAGVQARQAQDQKVTAQFLAQLRDGLDSGRFKAEQRAKTDAHRQGGPDFVGWYDDDGWYLLPAAYNSVAKWMRETGNQPGFSQAELYRMLNEEQLLARRGKDSTMVVRIGNQASSAPKRVLWLRRALLPPYSDADVEAG